MFNPNLWLKPITSVLTLPPSDSKSPRYTSVPHSPTPPVQCLFRLLALFCHNNKTVNTTCSKKVSLWVPNLHKNNKQIALNCSSQHRVKLLNPSDEVVKELKLNVNRCRSLCDLNARVKQISREIIESYCVQQRRMDELIRGFLIPSNQRIMTGWTLPKQKSYVCFFTFFTWVKWLKQSFQLKYYLFDSFILCVIYFHFVHYK